MVIDIVFFLLAWVAFNVLLFVIMVIAFMSINEAANSLLAGGGSLSFLQLIAFMAFVPISLLYAGYSIVDRGQTPGKRILKLQILDAKAGRFQNTITVILRYGLLFIPYFNVLVALSPLWNSDGRGWHDRFGRTVVIQYQKPILIRFEPRPSGNLSQPPQRDPQYSSARHFDDHTPFTTFSHGATSHDQRGQSTCSTSMFHMPTVVNIIENSALAPSGRIEQALERNNVEGRVTRPYLGDPIPLRESPDGWVVLGAEYGAYETEQFPFLHDEMELISQATEEETPLLGICLGAQLIAHSLGGRAFRAEQSEVGVVDLETTNAWHSDPVLGQLLPQVFTVHQDTFELPPQAVLLATSRYPQAFRIGSSLGIQFHPETPASVALSWASELEDLLAEAEVELSDYVRMVEESEELLAKESAGLFDRWLETLSS